MTPLFKARSVNRTNELRTTYGAEDKRSLVQQIHVKIVITFIESGSICLVLVGLMTGRPADKNPIV